MTGAGVFFFVLCPSNTEQEYLLNIFALLFKILYLLYYMILYLYPVNEFYLTLASFSSPKMFVLIASNSGNFCYSTDSLPFSISHFYFKTCNLLTPISFLFFTFGKCLCFAGAYLYRMSLFSKKTTFLCLEDHDFMDHQEYSDFTVLIKICHLCSHVANRCLRRRQLCYPMKTGQKW